jgi:colanic acid/amylovoran biosynthesis glycosyltransferase
VFNPAVVIYRNYLLAHSETFIQAQAAALTTYTPSYVGLRLVPGLTLPPQQYLVINSGGLPGRFWELATKLYGFPNSFRQQIRQRCPQLIHAHFGQDGAMALPLSQALNLPLVVTFHGADISIRDDAATPSRIQRIYLQRREQLKRDANLFIAVSEFIKQRLIDQGFPAEKIIVHYIGIDPNHFQPRLERPRDPMVLFVGRLVEKKGCQYLIKAMARVQALLPHVKLVIIGDGPLRTSLEQLAQQLLSNYCFLGIQTSTQVRDWMQRASLFCVPSVTANSGDVEGFGMVFAEAQAMGLPVVSFKSGGIPEAVAHDQTGFLATERDVGGLTAYLLLLLQNPELWHRMSQNGRDRIMTCFNLHKQTRVLEALYTEVIDQHPCDRTLHQNAYQQFQTTTFQTTT